MGSRARLLVWFSKGATATRRWTSRIGDVDCAGRRMRTIAAAPASITIPASTPATIRERRPGPLDGAVPSRGVVRPSRSEEHTSELQSLAYLVCRLLLEKKKKINISLE